MSEWFSSFLAGLDKESVTILGTGFATILVTVYTGIKGFRKGKPVTTPTAHAIAQMSCGAPEMKTEIITLKTKCHEQIFMLSDMKRDIDRLSDMVTRIEDRTRQGRGE